MKKAANKINRGLVGLACGLLVAVGMYAPISPVTYKAHAFPVVVVGDAPSEIQRILDGIGWMAAKTVVNSLTQSIVNWINSGFEGSPAFESDLKRNLGRLGDAVAEDFLRGLDQVVVNNTGFSVRAPFQDQLARELRREFYRTTSSYGFDLRYPYRDCYGGRGFSISGFLCESQNPANNPYGRYTLARNELFAQIDEETQNRLRELDWGRGFLSWRGPCGRYGNEQAAIDQAKLDGKVGADLSQTDNTVGCSIRTPGAVIEEALGVSVTSPFRQLELADNINEIIAALATQLMNQVLGGGGLSGVSRPSSGGGQSYIDRTGNPAASLSGGFAQNIRDARTQFLSYQSGWQRIRDAASSARQACRNDREEDAEATRVYNLATQRLQETSAFLIELESIESERARIASAGTSDLTTVNNLINRFTTLLSRSGAIAEGGAQSQNTGTAEGGSMYSQMVRLQESC